MAGKSVVLAFFVAATLACGCAVESVERFGRGGIVSIESKPCVYDFSKDGKYLWLSETNCYDLSGRKVKTSLLEDASGPLPRLKWKKRVLGSAWNYSLSSLGAGNDLDKCKMGSMIAHWAAANGVAAQGQELSCLTIRWTFPEESPPVVAAKLRVGAWPGGTYPLVWGILPDADEEEMSFRAVRVPNELRLPLGWNWTLSGSMQHIASSSSIDSTNNPRLRFSDIGINGIDDHIGMSNEVFVIQSDLKRLVKDDGLMFDDFCGPGFFLNEDYFVFAGTTGGRMKLTARDYLFVYGFRERRIVKAFKSHLRLFDEGYHINDVDVVLSADEKYLAIRYDGVITVYPFRTDAGVEK